MKVIKVRAKVVSPKLYTQEQMDSMSAELGSCRNQIIGLKQKAAGYESLYHAAKEEAAEWEKTSKDLANRLCAQMDAARKAEEAAVDLNLELMERECRINALERRIEWLEAHSAIDAEVVS